MFHLFQFSFFLLCFLFNPLLPNALSYHNSSSHLCHHDEKMALLQFKNSFTVGPQYSMRCSDKEQDYILSYPKTHSWKVDTDCCLWDGVTCDSTLGHVIGLDLSCSQLGGIMDLNSTLFHLSHLQYLNLANNEFFPSRISSNMANISNLKVLDLSNCGFSGEVPFNFGLLSQLVSLDLSVTLEFGVSSYPIFDLEDSTFPLYKLEIPHFDRIIGNLTDLRKLHLDGVLISSALPHTLANLSSLSSLQLRHCNLQGAFHSNILRLPHLQNLDVATNPNLHFDFSLLNSMNNISLEVIDFSNTSLSGRLPEYTLGRRPTLLRQFLASNCNLFGTIPSWIWNTTEAIWLDENHFIGELPSIMNTDKLSSFTSLGLGGNLLKGPVPSWLLNIPSLEKLNLAGNQFNGKVIVSFPKDNCSLEKLDLSYNNLSLELSTFSKCNNLGFIGLSNISLIDFNSTNISWPNLCTLVINFSNITKFPEFLKSPFGQKNLYFLDLSNNMIQGEIPTWLYNVGNSMFFLNISHNNLTGNLDLLSWKGLVFVDFRFNSLEGLLPLPPSHVEHFFASNNKFHGEINESFCNLTNLVDLDLSNNRLSGKLPNCLGKLIHNLEILDLGSNFFHGIIPRTISKECNLKSIHLNDNLFEGMVPQSLMWCKHLEVLDLRKNRFNGSFPHWLDSLPELKVLILQSNNFQGSIEDELKANKHPFPKLQILDLSGNHFCGKLPAKYIQNFRALMLDNGGRHPKNRTYIGELGYYQDTLVLTMKGLQLKYKILTILAALDFSNNKFNGKIPDSVGKLVALVNFNVSHNQLTGPIPPSLGKLTSLQSLDLSCNWLEGKIPQQLVRLTFLEVFNVAKNQLSGPIPQGSQFNTFQRDSYEGNSGLCGDPLPRCEKGGVPDHQPAAPASQQDVNDIIDIITSISLWEIILIGFGLGATLGLVAGYCMISSERPNWFSRKADKFEYVMVQRSKKILRRRQRRA